MSEDRKISERYRELGAEAPPRHIDEAILAASRRAAKVHPAPLVAPTGRRRWYFPLAAAAVIVLAVAVTVHVERDRPDPESAVLAQAPQVAAEARKEEKAAQDAAVAQRRAKPFSAPPLESQNQAMRESAPVAGARAPEAARSDRALGKISEPAEPPEKWLERIAALRKEGKHEEADKALEEFRKRYPDYKIPESALKK